MADELPVRNGARSRAERGDGLAREQDAGVVYAEHVELARKVTVADAFRIIGLSCLRQVSGNEAAVRRGDPEGVHQMRIGLRRLRAALSLFKAMLPERESEAVKVELRWLTEQLGPARDYHVFAEETVGPLLRTDPHHRELGELKATLGELRALRLEDAKRALASDRCRQLFAGTALWLSSGEWASDRDPRRRVRRAQRMRTVARKILRRRAKKILKELKRLDRLAPGERHALRIAAKKLRYGSEFFASLFPRANARRKFLKVLKELQDTLGRLNDLRIHDQIAADVLRAGAIGDGRCNPTAAFAVGLVMGREGAESARLLEDACKLRGRLAKLAPSFC